MTHKMATGEDFSIITKSGGSLTVPDIPSGESAVAATVDYTDELVAAVSPLNPAIEDLENGQMSVAMPSGDLLIVFTDAANAGRFTLNSPVQARILAIGGGGGGGGAMRSSYIAYPMYGGGGGGGGGGFVDITTVLPAGTYTVGIGSGGSGGASTALIATVTPGGDGGATTILKDNEPWLTVAGGGGGGGIGQDSGAGRSGGSGGGGSQYSADGETSPSTGIGGSGVAGSGHAGGAGDANLVGGGGGGAGAAGDAASVGGKGGDGKKSNITGEDVYYAGGGGGARNGTGGNGGQGGGGAGGAGVTAATRAKEADFYGSGGGGGCRGSAGGKGADGVVYIRIPLGFRWGGKASRDELTTKADSVALAPAYDATAAYSVGDPVTHDGRRYVCNTAIMSGGEPWTAAHWTEQPVQTVMDAKALASKCKYEFNASSVAVAQTDRWIFSADPATEGNYYEVNWSYDVWFLYEHGESTVTEIASVGGAEDAASLTFTLQGSSTVTATRIYEVTGLVDHEKNKTTLGSDVGAANIVIPARTDGYTGDLFLNLTIEDTTPSRTAPPSITFTDAATSDDLDIIFGAAQLADIDTGRNLILFSEVEDGKWKVAVEHEDFPEVTP